MWGYYHSNNVLTADDIVWDKISKSLNLSKIIFKKLYNILQNAIKDWKKGHVMGNDNVNTRGYEKVS